MHFVMVGWTAKQIVETKKLLLEIYTKKPKSKWENKQERAIKMIEQGLIEQGQKTN